MLNYFPQSQMRPARFQRASRRRRSQARRSRRVGKTPDIHRLSGPFTGLLLPFRPPYPPRRGVLPPTSVKWTPSQKGFPPMSILPDLKDRFREALAGLVDDLDFVFPILVEFAVLVGDCRPVVSPDREIFS